MKKIAVILAAGIGSRLRPETYEKPKCLVNIEGKPILEYQLTALEKIDIDEIIIVIGYLSDKVQKYIRMRKNKIPVKLIRNERYLETNNMYSLKLALDYVGIKNIAELYVINGDVIIEPKIAKVIASSEDTSAIAIDNSQYLEESMKVIIKDGFVKDISKNISPIEFSAVSIDFYKFIHDDIVLLNTAIEEFIQNGYENLWTEVAIQRIIQEKDARIKPANITGLIWWEIDNKIDKERAEYRIRLLNKSNILQNCEIFAFDLDGTILLGNKEIPGASDLIEFLKKLDKRVYFITNNSSMPNPQHYQRLSNILHTNISPEMIFSSLDYIGEILLREKSPLVYALLPKSSINYLASEYGITFVEDTPDVVLVGFDTELSYDKLKKASIFIQKGTKYYLVHPDVRCPTEEGFIPDAGSISKVIELTTKKRPEIIGGKPNPEMLKKLAEIHNTSPEKICYVGDRLETDIKMATDSGAVPILFLTGETTFEDIYQNTELKEKIILGENPKFLLNFLQKHWD